MAAAGSAEGWQPEAEIHPKALKLIKHKLWQGCCGKGVKKDANKEWRARILDEIEAKYPGAVEHTAIRLCILLPGMPKPGSLRTALQFISDNKLPVKTVGGCCCGMYVNPSMVLAAVLRAAALISCSGVLGLAFNAFGNCSRPARFLTNMQHHNMCLTRDHYPAMPWTAEMIRWVENFGATAQVVACIEGSQIDLCHHIESLCVP
jgi:hypothetical protein